MCILNEISFLIYTSLYFLHFLKQTLNIFLFDIFKNVMSFNSCILLYCVGKINSLKVGPILLIDKIKYLHALLLRNYLLEIDS